MESELTFFEIMRIVVFWTSPIIFVMGVILVLYSNYKRLEELFGRKLFGVQFKLIPALETNIYNFHEWLLERRTLVGLIFVIFSVGIFFIFNQ